MFVLIIQWWHFQTKHHITNLSIAEQDWKAENGSELGLKLVLFYTPLFGRIPWPGLKTDHDFTHSRGIGCREQACRITYNRNDLIKSDAVLFHGRDLPSVSHMVQMKKRKLAQQRWIYFMHESPVNDFTDVASYNGLFNWTMTYRKASDFFLPYRHYTRLEPNEIQFQATQTTNFAEGKDKLAVWIASHCGLLRDEFVRTLMKFIKMDIFGSCSKKFNHYESCPRGSPECSQKLLRYKFYFAFENSFCVDYITEKYWYVPLDHNIVPVVMGGASYKDEQLAIPGSFIDVASFQSVDALVKYLLYLDSNDTAYNEYFHWRKEFKLSFPESWTCKVCAALHNDTLPSKVYNLDEFWGVAKSCGKNEDKIRKFIAESPRPHVAASPLPASPSNFSTLIYLFIYFFYLYLTTIQFISNIKPYVQLKI
ncbi:3-galactosyl-N-acetylglucosaminide 4-alpha-L-fucosyltransferase FUT3-like [Montipora capricornis]|uniref:3-galactosyl-N-acetylglucosaminide 4-alpha-L-fucosyltransferase FUT3-like n=1 Tax=Montipora capricornis TaxID=246305 RepID=UPI0035F103DF